MSMSEEAISFLEKHIPELAQAAVTQAYWAALASGSSVLERKNGSLVETHPDGTQTIIKQLPPLTTAIPGQKIELK